jgi:tetratricopeptide (TPR) repeat protein
VTALLVALLLAPSGYEALTAADKLAAQARALEPPHRGPAVERALAAYEAVVKAHPKDRRLVPRVRRRKATLLRQEKRFNEALAEHDAIVAGRARRKDKARAIYDGASLLEKSGALQPSEERYAQAVKEYPDIDYVRAKASLARGRVLVRLQRGKEAEACWRHVVDRCGDHAKVAIDAYDRLALLAIARGDPKRARRWIYACVRRYEKRASRGDRYGAFLSRLMGDMKSPHKLTEALAEASKK